MRYLFLAWHACWFARVALLPVLLVVIIRRKLYQQFPVFAAYTGLATVAGFAFVIMNYAPAVTGRQYLQALVVDIVVETIFCFAVIYELYVVRLRHYESLRPMAVSAFRWATILLIALAIGLAWLAPGRGANNNPMTTVDMVNRTVNTLQCGLLLFVFAFFGYFRLPWRSHAFGIALGMGVMVSASVASNAIRSQIESKAPGLILNIHTLVNEGAYLISVTLWGLYLWAPERVAKPLTTPVPDHNLETWNQALRRLLK